MRKTGITGAFMLAFACAAMQPTLAQNCQLKLINSVPITMAAGGLRPLVPIGINGAQKMFLLDTGGAVTQIDYAAVEEMKLPRRASAIKMLDVYGNAAQAVAVAESLSLGRLQERNAELQIGTSLFSGESSFIGLLAADYMAEYEIELDFAGGKMNFFSKDHCEGKVVYWEAAGVAVVPMMFRDHHVIIDLKLDGKPFRAILDTGAPGTTLFADEAKRVFDVTEESAGSVVPDPVSNPKTFERVFDSLGLEGLSINKPRITVIPDLRGKNDPNNHMVTGTRLMRQADRGAAEATMLIGMNILNKLRLFISFKEERVYVTPATAPAALSNSP